MSNIHALLDFESLEDLLQQLNDNDIILAVENKDPGNYTFLAPTDHDTFVVDVMLPASHGFEFLVCLDWDDQWFYICAQTSEDAKGVFQEICRLAGKGERKKLSVEVGSNDDQKRGKKYPLPIEKKPMQGPFPNVDIEFEHGEVLTPHQASNLAVCFESVTFNNCRMASKVVADTFVKAVGKGATLQEIIFYNTEYSVGLEIDASCMTRLVQQSCNNSNAPKLVFQVAGESMHFQYHDFHNLRLALIVSSNHLPHCSLLFFQDILANLSFLLEFWRRRGKRLLLL